MLDELEDRRLIFVTGKGGVGKSTMVASLGRALAERGNQTLVVETDAYSAMEDLLGVTLSDNAVSAVDPPLHAIKLLPSECIVDTIARFVPSERIVRTILNNRVARIFFNAAPGVDQFALLDQVRQFLDRTDGDEPRWDNIIVDLPASGHAVTFLSVPSTFRDLIKVGPIAEAASELADIVEDPARSAILAICLPEEMPVNETIEFQDKLRDAVGRGLTLTFANMVHRAPLSDSQKEKFADLVGRLDRDELIAETISGKAEEHRAVERVIAGNVLAMDWYERDERYLGVLREGLDTPVQEVPVIYETEGGDIVEGIVEFLLGTDNESGDESSETLAS